MARILLLTADFPPFTGGIASDTYAFSRMLSMRHETDVFAFGVRGADKFGAAPVLSSRLKWKTEIKRICGNKHYDLIVVKTVRPLGLMTGSCRAKKLFYVHGSELRKNILGVFSTDMLLRDADILTANSSYTASLNARITDVFNPCIMPARCMRTEEPGMFRILCLGRLVRHKNFSAMPRIVRMANEFLSGSGIRAKCIIAGEGPEMSAIERNIEKEGMGEHFRMPGRISDERKWELFSESDLLAVPSIDDGVNIEGFGMTVHEAGQCGVPSLAYRIGGLPESVGNENMLICINDESGFAQRITELASNTQLYSAMAENAKTTAERYIISEKRLSEFEKLSGIGSGGRI